MKKDITELHGPTTYIGIRHYKSREACVTPPGRSPFIPSEGNGESPQSPLVP